MPHRLIQPEGWPKPSGYAHGVLAEGRLLFIAGQTGIEAGAADIAGQAEQALEKIAVVLREAGGSPEDLVRLVWYVADLDAYRAARKEIGQVYRRILGRHFPAMTVVEVSCLLELSAFVEIEATAVVISKNRPYLDLPGSPGCPMGR